MHIYEKEIYSHEIPLYKREVMGVIEDFCHVPSDEIAGDIPGYFLSDSENKVNIIHRSDLPKFDAESLIIIKPEGELIGPDYFGYVEIKEIIEQVEIPIHIRIVSYQEKLNMFWMRLAEKIINKIHEKLPNFASELDFNNPSKSS